MQSEREEAINEPELDSASLDAIRSLMANHVEPAVAAAPPPPLAELKARAGLASQNFTPPEPSLPRRKADGLPDLAEAPPEVPHSKTRKTESKSPMKSALDGTQSKAMSKLDNAKAQVLGYRPKPKHVLWGGFAVLILLRPWLVFGLLFLFLFVIGGVFLFLGYDGFWHRAMAIGRRHARRHPERSAELHGKLDQFAVRWDAILDRFPEGSVDGLYLPDFADMAEAEARHHEAMERRLSSLKENQV